ncbi:hypothetical protein [Bradyrhizobium sp. dw_78]|uniref:hypothetical protein n=1 Tax=Bradyrhizobium sp. dw_78 TaxID=2719793 RepID=UPI001BD40975|nr:hypothetical protein [Bradyrhizobium sp. dw_78]
MIAESVPTSSNSNENNSRLKRLWRILICDKAGRGAGIVISFATLPPHAVRIPLVLMRRWRTTMRELSAEARLHFYARSLSGQAGKRLHAAALYGAFAVIAAVVSARCRTTRSEIAFES